MSRHADRSQAFNDIFGRPSTSRPVSTAGPPQLLHGPTVPVQGRSGPHGHAQYVGLPPHGHLQPHPSQHYHHQMQSPPQHLQPSFHAGGYAGPSGSSGRPISYGGPSKGYSGGYQQLGSIQEQETPVRVAHGSAPAPLRSSHQGPPQHLQQFVGHPVGHRSHDAPAPIPGAAMSQQPPYRQPSYGHPPAGYGSPTPDLYASTSSLSNVCANGSSRSAHAAAQLHLAQQGQLSREPSMYNAYPVTTVAATHVQTDVNATPRVHSSAQAGPTLLVGTTNSPKLPSLDLDHEEFNWFAAAAPAMSAMSSTASSSKRYSGAASFTGQSGPSGADTGTSTPSGDSTGGISPAHTPGSGLTHESEGLSPDSSGMGRLSDYASIDSVPGSATSAPASRDFANDVEAHRHSPGAMSDPHYNEYRSYSRHSTAPTYRTSMDSDHRSAYQHTDSYDSRTSYPSASTSQTSHTYVNTPAQHYAAPSSASSHQTLVSGQHQLLRHNSSRRSTESMRVYPTQPRSSSAYGDRSLSFSGMMDRPLIRPPSHSPHNSSSIAEMSAPSPTSAVSSTVTAPWPGSRRSHRNSESSVVPRRGPVVYPAMLSRVADAFRNRIMLAERVKDGLSYTDAFDGREAVDKIAYIIRTTDRNLALLLGRALDAQKFFHDVTYDHRLRDSPHELYQFRERLHSGPFGSSGAQEQRHTHDGHLVPIQRPPSPTDTMLSEDSAVPVGVFTLLTDCYSPTCTRDRLCYSIACPRRLEQQARLNMKLKPGLKKSQSEEGLLADDDRLGSEPGQLWIHSVSKEISDAVDDTEKKRQEAINELIYTERDFVRDMEYLQDKWMTPLRTGTAVPESRRNAFVDKVFYNVMEIHAVNIKLAEALTRRQKQQPVVQAIGDILLKVIPDFEPFVRYGAHQLYGKYEFEKEKGSNASFLKFVETTERLPESRKLELNGYLTKPTTRLARYPLLLEAILKNTPEANPDKENIPKCVKLVREYLTKVNHESGRTEARFNLSQLTTQLVFRPGEAVDLDLGNENRDLAYKGPLKKKGGTQSESADLQVFLFDHAILMVKGKAGNTSGKEQFKVYRRPIPLELLVTSCADEPMTMRQSALRPRSLVSRTSTASSKLSLSMNGTVGRNPEPTSKQGFPITFTYLGRKGYALTLWSPSHAGRKKWLDKIEEQQDRTRTRSMVLETTVLSEGFFTGTNRISCAAPFDGGSQMIYGTDNGVYLANLHAKDKAPMKVISLLNVTQVEVLEDYGILIVLADRAVQSFLIDNLDPNDAVGAAKRARKISTNATFLKTGVCSNRTLVCIVKSGTVSSTIKTLEPVDPHGKAGKKQPAFRKLLQGNHELLRIYKEFYIPYESSSMHFLKSKLCVGCVKGFEIVDLDTLDTQGLLDPADASLDFVQKRENVRPIAIYRVDGDFLLCYDEFAFYVNKNGWRARATWIVQWEGNPTAFALYYPYIVAFEPNFVEVRHVDTGRLMQIIPGYNVRLLYADTTSASASAPQSTIMPPYATPSQAMLQQQMRLSGRPMPGSPHMAVPHAMLPVGFAQQVKVPPTPRKHIVFSGDGCILTMRDVS